MIFSEPAPIHTIPVQVTAEQEPQAVDNGSQSGGYGSSGSEDRDEPMGQLAEPTIITIPSEDVEETETTRHENVQVEVAEETETNRGEREAELSDVEEKGYCNFRSERNIEMNLELVCVESEDMKLLYRNTERVRSYYILCSW